TARLFSRIESVVLTRGKGYLLHLTRRFFAGDFAMRTKALPSSDSFDPDLVQVQRALRRIEDPHTRYFLAQLIELVADGIDSHRWKASAIARRFESSRSPAGKKPVAIPSDIGS